MTPRKSAAPLTTADQTDTYVGARLRERRLALGMSQTDLGAAAGISFQQVQKYERGVNRIAISMLNVFAEALRMPLTYFLPEGSKGMAMASDSKTANYNAGTSKETNELLTLFEGINDPKMRKQVLELTKTLSQSAPKKRK